MENNSNNVLIEIKDLKKSFGDQKVLDGVNLELLKNENLVVLGKSGSGKSVLIKCIVSLLKHDEGSIKVGEHELTDIDEDALIEVRKKIGFLFQGAALYDSMTVRENLTFALSRLNEKFSEEEINDKIVEALENVGMPDSIDKMPSELSGGMKKRIGLARTLVVNPNIILYDEPTTGLDPITSDEISNLINDTKTKFKNSSIIITHDINCVKTVADRIAMIKDGKVYKVGSLEAFINDEDTYIQSFFK
ncbi:phospholipid/cholesterol/gamma-HCH transport system ATP-binding protein [Mariniflexile fucanivorans]|uniref:Phospholipid/cholesterol/gamma-HCH transport system ATP-binding protein n=1 Tax=Mariniflexile fucanivorans TaxID=264023 RepID=A0A4R1RN28_9FLAO|nr:ATP-binding cassette domain-containing protein [Mariniflexile fucanivorans]TCL67616.1 phospholipid/cholesterol/gamma-HCH transport system ATP-binding protein [Mariniflexile fucanivorans]